MKPQSEFPLLEDYKKVFAITYKTIFAYDDIIYTNYPLPPDLLVHEKYHLQRQAKQGVDIWVANFLTDPEFRLEEEALAYKAQLESIKDRELRNKIRIESARNLSSSLYGNIINFEDAFKLLKI
jgi:hypothetical protein